jgi:hypothetical protein
MRRGPESRLAESFGPVFKHDLMSVAAEHGTELGRSVETLLIRAAFSTVTNPRRIEIPRQSKTPDTALTSQSAGSIHTSTLAIAHTQGTVALLDLIREAKPPSCTNKYARTAPHS